MTCTGPFCSKSGCEFIGNVRQKKWAGLNYTIGDVKCDDAVTLPTDQQNPNPWDYSELPKNVLEPYVNQRNRLLRWENLRIQLEKEKNLEFQNTVMYHT